MLVQQVDPAHLYDDKDERKTVVMWKERKRYISEERIKSEPKKRESYEDSKYPFEVVLVLVRFNNLCEAFQHVCGEFIYKYLQWPSKS